MKKVLSIALIVFLFATPLITQALADEACENDCIQNDYDAKFCKERCDYNLNPLARQQTIRQVEPKCLEDCTNSGRDSTYCNKTCSY